METSTIIQKCKPKTNNNNMYQKTKEWKVVKYLRDQLPDQEFIHNRSVGSECTKDDRDNSNGHLFPDILFDCDFYNLIVEVDEFRHRGIDYSCDKRRMYDIIAKLGMPCIFIRYNPDNNVSCLSVLLDRVNHYLNLDISDKTEWDEFGFKAEYLFY
jgi:hypothetical protein